MPTGTVDTTFPADTQLANQLGADLRNVMAAFQSRMGAISGLDAAKWNPGGDAQPANWTGLLFFATDTGKIYQWSGAAWVNVTADFITPVPPAILKYNDPVIHAAGTNSSVVIPAASLAVGSRISIRFVAFDNGAGGAGARTFQLLVGNTPTNVIASGQMNGTGTSIEVRAELVMTSVNAATGSVSWQGSTGDLANNLNLGADLNSVNAINIQSNAPGFPVSQNHGPLLVTVF